MEEKQAQNNRYSDKQIKALERTLSLDRLTKYLAQANGDKQGALRLYERNTELSEALYGVLQGLEITVRNSISRAIQKGTGTETWYDTIHLEDAEAESLRQAKEALQTVGKTITAPRIIAKVNFGFWVRLTASVYEKTLWITYLYKVVPMKLPRSLLYKRLLGIKDLRNRIAHHQRILTRDLDTDYSEILETIKWFCPITSDWVRGANRFEALMKQSNAGEEVQPQ